MRYVLVAGGLDPSGGAGITADALHLADLGVFALPVATCATVQTPDRFQALHETAPSLFEETLRAALASAPVAVAKTGLLASPQQVEVLARVLRDHPFPVVVDPVATPSMQRGPRADQAEVLLAIRRHLLPRASLVTPNLDELALLVGRPVHDEAQASAAAHALAHETGAAVLVTGMAAGDEVVDLLVGPDLRFVHARDSRIVHGTGCALASRIAGYLANDMALERAVALAVQDLRRLRAEAQPTGGAAIMMPFPTLGDDDGAATRAVETALPELLAALPAQWIAECGANVAYAPPGAASEREVAALVARIRLLGGRPHAPTRARLGASGHVARVALAAAATLGEAAAINLRHGPGLLDAAQALGLRVGRFDRSEEPATASSSVEWGTRAVFTKGPVDLVVDEGGPGKEPMVRLIAADPAALVARLVALVAAAHGRVAPVMAV